VLLRGIRDAIGDSVLLAKAHGLAATYLKVFEPTSPLRFSAKVGDPVRALHATSGGKALLSRLDSKNFGEYLKIAKLTPLTKNTITSKAALRENIAQCRERRWFLNRGESVDDLTTLSGTFEWNGSLYIVTIAGLSSRLDRRLEKASKLLLDACDRMEMQEESLPPSSRRSL
jgi:DNA-binding IclR family transcriptional regulator